MYKHVARRPVPADPAVRSGSLSLCVLPPPLPSRGPPSRTLARQSSLPLTLSTRDGDWNRYQEEEEEEEVYEEVAPFRTPFSDVVEKQLRQLPIVVELGCSLYGLCDDLTLTVGQEISLHFSKKTEVAMITGKHGSVLSVPLNTSLRFSPLCEDVNEYSYPSVKKLASAKPPPLVVCVSEIGDAERRGKSLPNVQVGDILILNGGRRRSFRTGHVLWFNTRSNQDIRLSEQCPMRFTAMSERTMLSLPVLLKHIALPQRCFVYTGNSTQPDERRLVRKYFQDGMCTILCRKVENSFIGSMLRGRGIDATKTLEIDADFDAPVRIVKKVGPVHQSLIEKSCDLFRSFRPEVIDWFICSKSELAHAKLNLRKSVCESNRMMGITLVHLECLKPPAFSHHDYDNYPFRHKKQDVIKQSDTCREDVKALQKGVQNLKLHVPKQSIMPVDKSAGEIRFQANECYRSSNPITNEPNIQEINRTFLRKLECKQVLQLLDNMSLGVYKSVFQRENITGDLLLGFDESILERELGVKSKIHRLKFMKLITGQYSAAKFLL